MRWVRCGGDGVFSHFFKCGRRASRAVNLTSLDQPFLTRRLFALLFLSALLCLGLGASGRAVAQEPECPPGFKWVRMSGVGCVQEDCLDIPNAKLSYTSSCICLDGYKGCSELVDYTGFDREKCGPHCPNGRLIACIDPEATCPNEEPAPPAEQEAVEPEAATEVEDEAPEPADEPSLVRDLERFLAGEGVKGPSSGQTAASGAAVSTLIGAWVLTQLLAGQSLRDLLEAVRTWRRGPEPLETKPEARTGPTKTEPPEQARPPEVTSPDAPSTTTASATGSAQFTPSSDAQRTGVPAQQGVEGQVRRYADDFTDYHDALTKSRDEFKTLTDKLQKQFGETEFWKQRVKPMLDQVSQTTDLSKMRSAVERLKHLLDIRTDVDRRLSDLPPDQREAVVWLTRGLRTGGYVLSDGHKRLVIDPAKTAISALLPKKAADAVNKKLDEQHEGIEEVAKGVSNLPVNATQNAVKASQRHQMRNYQWKDDTAGVWDRGKVEYPDFGRGWRKAERWYRDAKRFLRRVF